MVFNIVEVVEFHHRVDANTYEEALRKWLVEEKEGSHTEDYLVATIHRELRCTISELKFCYGMLNGRGISRQPIVE